MNPDKPTILAFVSSFVPRAASFRWAAAGLLLAAVLALAFVFFYARRPSVLPPPFKPEEIRYVADARCAGCHESKAHSFAEHPMGRSVLPVARATAPPQDPPHNNPFDALGSHFLVQGGGASVRHRRTRPGPDGRDAAAMAWDVQYVVGSGVRGYSYLTEREGYLFQTPISWYAQKEIWDLSPGFTRPLLTGRPTLPDCLFCHANRANHLEDSVNHYAEPVFDGTAIGCQRCHGPGERHVAVRERREPIAPGADDSIVNPRRLEPALRDAVCEQCHLKGDVRVLRRGRGLYDFRPGLPLELFWGVYFRAAATGEEQHAVGHVEQMYQSRCFRAGGDGPGRLGCVSCHDPHERVPTEQRVAHYRGRCLQCHQEKGCSLPAADRLRRTAEDSCIDCHMPRYGAADIPHTAATDHRIPRGGRPTPREADRPASAGGLPLISFYRRQPETDGGEGDRDLALALVRLALSGDASVTRALPRTLPLFEAAVRRDPADVPAREAQGYALALQGRSTEALAAFDAVLARAPDREAARVGAAATAEVLGQTEPALGHWRRAVAVNPWNPDYRRSLVLLLAKKGAWDEARPECEAWVRLDPFSAEARSTRVACLLAAGDKDEARAEFARIEALAPDNLTELRARYSKKLR